MEVFSARMPVIALSKKANMVSDTVVGKRRLYAYLNTAETELSMRTLVSAAAVDLEYSCISPGLYDSSGQF
jgi:hypothetical protein